MSIQTDKNNARQILAALTQLDIKAPAPVVAAYERTTRISAGTQNLAPKAEDLYFAVTAALDGRRDPAADEEVQRVLAGIAIANQGVMMGVDAILYDQLQAVCIEHSDALVTALARPFTQAAKTLTAAHQSIGDVALEDADAIIRKGGAAVDVWSGAQAAVTTINAVAAGWQALAEFTHLAPNDLRYPALRLAAVDVQTWENHELDRRKVTPWEATLLGLTLSLPSFGEYAERIEAIEVGRQRGTEAPIDRQRSMIAGREIRMTA